MSSTESTTPFQPTLPLAGVYTDAEIQFMEDSPPGLFPDNQNSNLGLIRRIFTNQIQELIDQQQTIYNERFVDTSEVFLDEWEEQMGLPTNVPGKTVQQRRIEVLGRLVRGPFTNRRRNEVIEKYIVPTLTGSAVQLTPAGVVLDAAGIPLYSGEAGEISQFYRIYQNVRNFSYEVRIKNSITPDLASMNRELTRMTPAGISYTNVSLLDILDYSKAVLNDTPVGYWRLGSSFADSSGYGNTGTQVGTIAAIANPGLLASTVVSGSNGASDFDGSTGYVTVPHGAQYLVGNNFTIEALVRPDVLSGSMTIFTKAVTGLAAPPGPPFLYVNSSGAVVLAEEFSGFVQAHSSINLSAGTIYHVVATKNGNSPKIYIDGVDRTVVDSHSTDVFPSTTGIIYIGRRSSASSFFNGALDEVALYNYPLSAADVLLHHKTGKNLL